MSKLKLTLSAIVAAALCASVAMAQEQSPPPPPHNHPCKADREKFCAGVPHGGGKLAACLNEHEAELSDACKAAMAQHHGHKEGPPPAQ